MRQHPAKTTSMPAPAPDLAETDAPAPDADRPAKEVSGGPSAPDPAPPSDGPEERPIPDSPGQPAPPAKPDLPGQPGQNPDPAPRPIPPAAQRALAEAEARRRQARPLDLPPELGGRDGPEPVRYGDWEKKGLAVDF